MDPKEAIIGLSALAQEHRLNAFRLLVASGPEGLPSGQIAERIGVPASTMSSHLAQLERAGLVRSRRDQRRIIYSADFGGVRALIGFLVEDCCQGRPDVCRIMEVLPSACAGDEAPKASTAGDLRRVV